jgi:hypothetical protein
MSKWTLFPGDTDQWTVEVEHYDELVAVTVGDITTELTPAEARHLAGAIMYAARHGDEGRGAA